MANNNRDDEEYRFDEQDVFNPEEDDLTPTHEHPGETVAERNSPVLRNAIIAVGALIVLLIGYKIISAYRAKSNNQTIVSTPEPAKSAVAAIPAMPASSPVVQNSAPIENPPPASPPAPEVEQKLSDLQNNQQNIQNDLNNLSNQLSGMNQSVDNVNQKLENLVQSMNQLSQKIESQSQELAILHTRQQPKRVVKIKPQLPQKAPIVFYIQAIIPGRAWLIAPNGSTITVREGSKIPGYGSITLIEPRQGRVLTSSGRMIRFSPADS